MNTEDGGRENEGDPDQAVETIEIVDGAYVTSPEKGDKKESDVDEEGDSPRVSISFYMKHCYVVYKLV